MCTTKVIAVLSILILSALETQCTCEQRSFDRADVYICAEKCLQQTIRGCVDADDFIGKVRSVSFKSKVPAFRRTIFTNMADLKSVHAITTGIKKIYPGAFFNTPHVETIDFTFNFIEEIPWGFFNTGNFTKITLSWNNISYVEDEAFSNLLNLKTVVLTRNNLDDFDKMWFKDSVGLEALDLSYNKISKLFARSFDIFPDLRFLDLSFNRIVQIGAGSLDNVKSLQLLDLTGNNLTSISPRIFPEDFTVKELRAALNRLSFLSDEVMRKVSVQSLAIYPNPWQCPCLDTVLSWARSNKIAILPPNQDYRINVGKDLPQCAFRIANAHSCVVGYDEEFLNTQEVYFQKVLYPNIIQEKPTTEQPNFDVIQIDTSFGDLSPL